MNTHSTQVQQDMHNIKMLWLRFDAYRKELLENEHHVPPASFDMAENVLAGVGNANDINIASQEDFNMLALYGELMFHFGQYSAMNGMYRSNLEPCRCLEVSDEQIKAFFDGVNFGKGSQGE